MKVLVACEYSGTVREAFRKKGHDAISCDIIPTEIPGPHYEGDIFDILYDVGGNQYNHHTAKNVRRLIPFQNVWYLDWLFDDIQKGLH